MKFAAEIASQRDNMELNGDDESLEAGSLVTLDDGRVYVVVNDEIDGMSVQVLKEYSEDNAVTSGSSWNQDADEMLIDLVRQYPHLYVKTSGDKKDKLMVENSWSAIARVMNQSGSQFRITFHIQLFERPTFLKNRRVITHNLLGTAF